MTTLFFATDVHGSNICWKKFVNAGKFYGADILVLGGDMTGKAVVPIVHQGGDRYKATLLEQESILSGEEELQAMVKQIKNRGYYPYITTPDEIQELSKDRSKVDQIFADQVLKTAQEWMEYAEEKLKGTGIRCYVAPGNDDMFELDEVIKGSDYVTLAEGKVIQIDDHHEMVSSGYSNVTPWKTYREEEEEQLQSRYEAMIQRVKNLETSIFNFHVPPFHSSLDEAPELTEDLRPKYAGRSLVPVGSHAVRSAIEKYQPMLALHGHIHEGKGTTRIGDTLCVNPGSMYEQGRLLGAVVKLDKNKVKSYILTTG